ncbi:iron ABC transporter substrate-binding protein, partial [Bacillus sp. AFS076308]
MMFRNTLRRGLTFTLLGLVLATPLTQAADPVSLTLY